jgi:hypothetical protein
MKLIAAPMFIVVFVGLKTFLDHQLILIPLLCIVVFLSCFIMLVKWNVARLRGN